MKGQFIEQFYQYLLDLLDQYTILDDQVLHKEQRASSALIAAIQVYSQPMEKLSDKTIDSLKHICQVIFLCANQDQHKKFNELLLRLKAKDEKLFTSGYCSAKRFSASWLDSTIPPKQPNS